MTHAEPSRTGGSRARRSWQDLAPGVRRLILVTGAVEGALKIAALIDLARRPAAQVRGSKAWWAVAIVLVNSAGAVPVGYFRYGRRPAPGAERGPRSRQHPVRCHRLPDSAGREPDAGV